MARTASVGMIKGKSVPFGTHPMQGTKLRLVYDMLYEYRGRRMPPKELRALVEIAGRMSGGHMTISCAYRDLELYYGCDIRKGMLVGEWFGRIYIDYTAPAQAQARSIAEDESVPRELRELVRNALLGCRPGGNSASLELVV